MEKAIVECDIQEKTDDSRSVFTPEQKTDINAFLSLVENILATLAHTSVILSMLSIHSQLFLQQITVNVP